MQASEAYKQVALEMKKRIAGKDDTIELMFLSLVANGHTLLEGVPGVAKTTMTKTLADTIQADFKRIQGTVDLEPKDIIGYSFVDSDNSVKFRQGPVFTNVLLIDELNRTPPKVASAFLEALEERQVTVGGMSMPLPKPFNAFATQNPLRIEGTEPLPKVLADKFMVKIDVDYPSMKEEEAMLRLKESEQETPVKKVIDTQMLLDFQEQAKKIVMPDEVDDYIAEIVDATRKEIHIIMGASPRADIAFMQCGKAKALIEGRSQVTKADIKFLARPVLSHRIVTGATGGVGTHGVIDGILATLG